LAEPEALLCPDDVVKVSTHLLKRNKKPSIFIENHLKKGRVLGW